MSAKGIDEAQIIDELGLLETEVAVNRLVDVDGYISLKDADSQPAPEHIPENIKDAFYEGAKCISVNCPNAAATMFRLCVDFATKSLLPPDDSQGLTPKIRRDLGLRLPWLFDNGFLPETFRELSSCIREDGNDGAHAGTLDQNDAKDLLEFTFALLSRLYAEPERLRLAKERRDVRRTPRA